LSKGNNSPGLSRFAGVMRALAKGQVPTDLVLDFGEIQKNGSLLTNTVTVAVPKDDYLVLKGARHPRARRKRAGRDGGNESRAPIRL